MKRFPSVRKTADYQAVYKKGRSQATGLLVMYLLKNGRETNRLGISVGKKVGNSVVRHTFARKIREIFRLSKEQTVQGYDIIIVARNQQAGSVSYQQLERDYKKLLVRHGIFVETAEKEAERETPVSY